MSSHLLTPFRSVAVEDVVPFIDKMCRSGIWIEALGQANAGLTWCTTRYQADWKRNFGQLLCQHVISDAVGYKLEVIFGIEPVSLLSILCIPTISHGEAHCTTVGLSVNAERRRLSFSCLVLFSRIFLRFCISSVFLCFFFFLPLLPGCSRYFVCVYHAGQQKHAEWYLLNALAAPNQASQLCFAAYPAVHSITMGSDSIKALMPSPVLPCNAALR